MNHYLFNRESFYKFYNCSYYDVNLHPIQERQDILYGIVLILGSILFELLYLPIIPVLWKPTFQKESCYKLMGFIAIIDMIAITFNGTLTGFLAIKGAVYCTFPYLQLCAGSIAFSAWLMESNLALLLAIDRCLGMINKNLCEKIFTGKRIYLWIGLSGIYSIVVPISTDTPTYNALYGVWLINPHLGYPETGREYKNIIHHIHNIGIAFSLATFYLIFVLSLCKQKFSSQKQFSFSEKPIFLQVFLMSFMNFSCALIYVYEQHFPTPKLIMQFSQFGWMCIHGLPSIIYLVLNKLIRRDVFTMGRVRHGEGFHVFGGISWFGATDILVWRSKARMNSAFYCAHNIKDVVAEAKNIFPGGAFELVQDNHKSHVSYETREYLRKLGISTYDWPPQSPDWNPIEYVWRDMKAYIAERSPTSLDALHGLIEEFWKTKVTPEYCRKVIRLAMRNIERSFDGLNHEKDVARNTVYQK